MNLFFNKCAFFFELSSLTVFSFKKLFCITESRIVADERFPFAF